jgi:hypothetical protein
MKALMIATVLVAGAMLLPLGSTDARGGWCAEYNFGGGGATNCGFNSYQQCRAAISGDGGACRPG